MQHRFVAERNALANGEGNTEITMQDGAVLDVGVVADADNVIVTVDHDLIPETDIATGANRSDDGCAVREPTACSEAGGSVAEGVDGHEDSCFRPMQAGFGRIL